uniref:Uncharacterized protein n=1 Tax=Siphoviridae sp. ctXOZ1 TaxID=2823585 RepID=A0A8S5LBD9_9CAUD|nr:MAG TPA: hypothetical protein [Siphoviridae sp. ctXOZ1]
MRTWLVILHSVVPSLGVYHALLRAVPPFRKAVWYIGWGWLSKALRRAHNREFVESMTPYWWGRWYITRPCGSHA